MPKDKDFKRRVRARMRKTGESYTTARAQLLKKREKKEGGRAVGAGPAPGEYARLAGVRDETVHARTGRTWSEWVAALDAAGAAEMSHREIARHVYAEHDVSGWWAQTVTVGYERIRGLRDVGQQRSGEYGASKSKTFPVPIAELYRAFSQKRVRERWLPDAPTVRTSKPEKSMRLTWTDGTPVDVRFDARGASKSRVSIEHRKLPSKAAAERMKRYWADRLAALADLLGPAADAK